jgi:DNA-binding NarL/FixJ family response regulator
MVAIHWHRPGPPSGAGRPGPPAAAAPAPVLVSLSAGVHERLAGLAEALGRGTEVVVDEPQRSAVMIVGGIGPAGTAFLRARYPHAHLVVLDHHARVAGGAAAYLDAGADAYLSGASVGEVAAHVRALLRRPRLGPAATAPPPGLQAS